MIRKALVCLALATLGLAGCTLTPPYTRPAVPIPAAWPSGPAYEQAGGAPEAALATELPWREFFRDPALQEVITLALQHNRDLRLAVQNVERARAMYRIQRAELYPTVELSARASRERVQLSGTPGLTTVEQYGVNLGLSAWEIDLFGRLRSLSQQALENYFATDQARRSAQILLLAEVANAYLTLAADRDNLKLAQSTFKTQEEAYHLIRRRCEVGLAPELDLRQAQTRVDAARVDIARYTAAVARDENALNLLAGAPVPAKLLPASLAAIKPPTEVSPGLSSEVLLQRPDILQAEYRLKAAYANIGAARAAFFPRISLTSAVGTASGDLQGLFASDSFVWNYAPRLVLPIFDARTWAGLRVTRVERDMAVTQYDKAIQTAFREVADALATKGTMAEQVAAQQSLLDATAKTYELAKARYDKGIDLYLNVLDAQRSLYNAQQGLIALQLAKLANQVRLYAVLGGGSAAGHKPPPQ